MKRLPMTDAQETDCLATAVYGPELFGAMSPGQFADRFGVPSDAQWEGLREVIVYDECGKFRSIVAQGVEL